MVQILLTRPIKQSEALAKKLAQLGFEVAIEPLLCIRPTSFAMPKLNEIDATIITSGNTFERLAETAPQVSALFSLPCYCVGKRTAEKAETFGFKQVSHAGNDGVKLADLIIKNNSKKNMAFLHISARDIDSGTKKTLEAAGHNVLAWPIYQADVANALSNATKKLLNLGKIDVIMLFSARTADTLINLLKHDRLEACCNSITAIGLSSPISTRLTVLPWRQNVTAKVPTEEAMIDCLKSI